jgi:hypothetical protein
MHSVPSGLVPLSEAMNAVGRDSYGAAWIGDRANNLHRLTSQVRYRGPRNPEEVNLVAEQKRAWEQLQRVSKIVRANLLGSPPGFADAIPSILVSDVDARLFPLPPQIWIDDHEAWLMLATGRADFSPDRPNWRWSPTHDRISGILAVSVEFMPGRAKNKVQPGPAVAAQPPEGRDLAPENASPPAAALSDAPEVAGPTVAAKAELPSGIRTNRAEDAEAACGDWIRKLAERPTNKAAAFERAKAEVAFVGPLSGKAFDRAWARSAPTEWKRAGRRKQCS